MPLLSEALATDAADQHGLHGFTSRVITLYLRFTANRLLPLGRFTTCVWQQVPARQIRRTVAGVELGFLATLIFGLRFVQHGLGRRLDGAVVQRLRDSAQVGRFLLVKFGEMPYDISLAASLVAAKRAAVKLDEEVGAVVRVELDVLRQVLLRAEGPSAELAEARLQVKAHGVYGLPWDFVLLSGTLLTLGITR